MINALFIINYLQFIVYKAILLCSLEVYRDMDGSNIL